MNTRTEVKQIITTSWLLHPVLVVLFFLIHETNEGYYIEIEYFFLFCLLLVFSSIILFLTGNLWSSNKYINSYSCSFFLLFCLFFRYISLSTGIPSVMLVLFFSLTLFGFLSYSKSTLKPFYGFNYFLNITFSTLVMLEIIKIIYYHNRITQEHYNNKKISENNVYFLMLDGYAKNKNLKKYWNFNNSNFTDSLKKMGFHEIENSHTDYNYTLETVTSMFTLGDVSRTETFISEFDKKGNVLKLEKRLNDSAVVINDFQRNSYEFINLFTNDINGIRPIKYPFSSSSIFRNTIIFPIISLLSNRYGSYLEHQNDLNRIEIVKKYISGKKKRNIFLYFHSMMLHFPFCLDENQNLTVSKMDKNADKYIFKTLNSEPFQMTGIEKSEYVSWRYMYINHLIKLNKLILPLITSINKNDPNAIIIVASDHGSRLICDIGFNEARNESFENISFVYFPNRDYRLLNPTMTPNDIIQVVKQKCLKK